MMWQTSYGDRTLTGAEAVLVRRLIGWVSDQIEIAIEIGQPFQTDVEVFNELQPTQQMAILHEVAQALLVESPETLELTAVREGTVYVLFRELVGLIDLEIDLSRGDPEEDYFMRETAVAALEQEVHGDLDWWPVPDDVPDLACDTRDVWWDVSESLADRILWDRDFEMVGQFADQAPETVDAIKDVMGIQQNYFSEIAPDPNSLAFKKMRRELFALVAE